MYESAFAVAINHKSASVEQARQISHDTVLANTGRARRSGVTWTYYDAASAAVDLAAEGITLPADVTAVLGALPGGCLVVATVAVDEQVTP